MEDNNDISLPSVPDADGPSAFISVPDPSRVVPDLSYPLRLPAEIDPKTFGKSAGTPAQVTAEFLAKGEPGINELEREIRDNAAQKPNGKHQKGSVHYAPSTPIPFGAWEYKCDTCRFYVPSDESPDGNPRCEVVGDTDNLFGGENVHPEAWCALWLPEDGRGWFEWVTDRLEGTAIDGR